MSTVPLRTDARPRVEREHRRSPRLEHSAAASTSTTSPKYAQATWWQAPGTLYSSVVNRLSGTGSAVRAFTRNASAPVQRRSEPAGFAAHAQDERARINARDGRDQRTKLEPSPSRAPKVRVACGSHWALTVLLPAKALFFACIQC
jgi:hypothetical protein